MDFLSLSGNSSPGPNLISRKFRWQLIHIPYLAYLSMAQRLNHIFVLKPNGKSGITYYLPERLLIN
jgi:hypothetical protein